MSWDGHDERGGAKYLSSSKPSLTKWDQQSAGARLTSHGSLTRKYRENIYYGDIQQYPVYEQTEEEYRRRIANLGTDAPLASALNSHYKADKEQRDRGAAFVNFSQHADTRAEQQAAMRDIHRTAEVEKEKRRLAEEEEAQQVDAKALEGRRRVDEAKARKEAARKRALARAGGEPPSKVVRPDLT